MMNFLKNHPFAVEAFFESSVVLTFAVPKEQMEGLIPACLHLDTFQDKWAFLAVALVQTTGLRPKGLPRFLGNDFFLIGYRIFVRYASFGGKRLRGLYILKSETDKRKMELLGNIFTHYKYSTVDIRQSILGNVKTIESVQSKLMVEMDTGGTCTALPAGSPFADWKEARRYAGPLPHTFTFNPANQTVLIVEGVRQNWTPQPVGINKYEVGFLDLMNLENVVLASAFEIKEIPYHWKKGRTEKWQ